MKRSNSFACLRDAPEFGASSSPPCRTSRGRGLGEEPVTSHNPSQGRTSSSGKTTAFRTEYPRRCQIDLSERRRPSAIASIRASTPASPAGTGQGPLVEASSFNGRISHRPGCPARPPGASSGLRGEEAHRRKTQALIGYTSIDQPRSISNRESPSRRVDSFRPTQCAGTPSSSTIRGWRIRGAPTTRRPLGSKRNASGRRASAAYRAYPSKQVGPTRELGCPTTLRARKKNADGETRNETLSTIPAEARES
jgi:hypothetical protein